jgi:hypothetical protein
VSVVQVGVACWLLLVLDKRSLGQIRKTPLFKGQLITSPADAARRRWGANGIQIPPAYWLLEPLRAT